MGVLGSGRSSPMPAVSSLPLFSEWLGAFLKDSKPIHAEDGLEAMCWLFLEKYAFEGPRRKLTSEARLRPA